MLCWGWYVSTHKVKCVCSFDGLISEDSAVRTCLFVLCLRHHALHLVALPLLLLIFILKWIVSFLILVHAHVLHIWLVVVLLLSSRWFLALLLTFEHSGISIVISISILTCLITFLRHGCYNTSNRIICSHCHIHRHLRIVGVNFLSIDRIQLYCFIEGVASSPRSSLLENGVLWWREIIQVKRCIYSIHFPLLILLMT